MTLFEAVQGFYEQAADRLSLDQATREALDTPERELTVQVRVPMDDGSAETFPGWRVQYNSALGPYKGGLRFHEEASLDEFRCFAALMTWKTSLLDLPYGGGKGGVRVNPKLLSERELERLCRSFMRGIAPLIGPEIDIPAPDVNTSGREMAWMVDEYGRISGVDSRAVLTGKPIAFGGSLGRDAATGRGGLFALDHIAKTHGWTREKIRIAVEGYGNAGSWFAILAFQLGYRIVALSDTKGAIHNPEGIDPRSALEHKRESGSVVDFKAADTIDGHDLIGLDCEVLAPAALEESITAENADRVRANLVLELANYPVTSEADATLAQRGITVVPDILASAGGVVVSYLEWVQNIQRERWTEERVNTKLQELMEASTDAMIERANSNGSTFREAAFDIGVARVAEAQRLRGYR
jgi:glutamate dehydrogenase/leucine dehydrogenase